MSRRPKKKSPPEHRDLRGHKTTISGADDRGTFQRGSASRDDIFPVTSLEASNPYLAAAVCVFLLLAVGLVFGQTLRHGFVTYDDGIYVYENPQVAHGLTAQGIAWAFTSKHATNWHPLTWLSHMLDCQLYGLAPWGHHLTSVLLHAATAILLFLVLRRMTGELWPSAFVAAVFAIHPLRVESVAWVAERKDVLSGLFFMLTLWAYVGYVRHTFSIARYLMVMAFFALGLMAKPMLVTLPFVLLLLDYWPLGRMVQGARLRLALEKLPLLAMAAASCVLTVWAQSEAISANEHIPFPLRLSNAAVSYVAYVGQFFYPAGLAVLYPHPESALAIWKVVGSLLVLAAVCGVAVVWRQRYPYLFVGWFWYLGMLLPVIGLVQVGPQAMADRYTYLTQIGLCVVLAWGVARMCRSWQYRAWVCGAVSVLVLAVLMACAWHQTSFWNDSETLWNHTLECTSHNYVARNNLGKTLYDLGRVREAMEQFQQVLRLKANHFEAQNNLGLALANTGRPQEAIEHYEKALRLKPNSAEAHNNLGLTFFNTGRLEESHIQFEKALMLKPDYPEAHNNMGNVLLDTGRPQEAIEHFQQALRLKPDYPEPYNNLGAALLETNRPNEAMEYCGKALRLNPNFFEAHVNLGLALVKTGRPKEAIEYYQRALRLKPDFANVYYNLALAYAATNNSTEAITTAQKAFELARSQGQTEIASQIEEWLNSYRLTIH